MNADPLAVVAEQRRRLAERVRPPWWYWASLTAGTAAVLVSQYVDAQVSGTAAQVVIWPGILVYLLTDWLFWRSRGLQYPWSPRAFPGTLGPTVVMLVVLLVLMGLIHALSVVAPPAGLIAVALGIVVVMAVMVWAQRAIRADIRAGRVRAS